MLITFDMMQVNVENLSEYGSSFIEIHIASPRNNDFGLSVKVWLLILLLTESACFYMQKS